jgi:predicted enzyme related to lactoylglutathione lyase
VQRGERQGVGPAARPKGILGAVASASRIRLVEFPADDPERARRFWTGVLGIELEDRGEGEGQGWQTRAGSAELGLHLRGPGPGDRVSLPYFAVPDLTAAVVQVEALGGSVIHPGHRWVICRDSEGSPFGLTPETG